MRQTLGADPLTGSNSEKMFDDIEDIFLFKDIFETGTYHGTTTAHFTEKSNASIFTVESSARNYGYCAARFRKHDKIYLFKGDSREFLQQQLDQRAHSEAPIFCYLDAHWLDDLPLLEECKILLDKNVPAVIMIDDFEVKGDPGYTFDDYGAGKRLCLEYLSPLKKDQLSVFFPNCLSANETGERRGSVVLGTKHCVSEKIRTAASLTEYVEGLGC